MNGCFLFLKMLLLLQESDSRGHAYRTGAEQKEV